MTEAPRPSLAAKFAVVATAITPQAHLRDSAIATALVSPLVIISAYGWLWTGNDSPGEYITFEDPARALLTGDWGNVFSDPGVQAGPFELIPYGVLALLDLHGTVAWVAYYTLFTLPLLFLFLVAALSPVTGLDSRRRTYLAAAAGAAAVLGNFVPWALQIGHPAQTVIPSLWLLAAVAARRGHSLTAGILIGLSAGWETWGVLGAPVVLCAAHPRVVRAGIGALATVAATYVPFMATGSFAMGDIAWPVRPETPIAALFPGVEEFTWQMRLAQAALALGVGVVVALLTRHSAHSVWLTGLAVLAARLTLDPLEWTYYWISPGVLLIAGALLAVSLRQWALAAVVTLTAAWIAPPLFQALLSPRSIAGILTLFAIAAIVLPLWVWSAHRFRPSGERRATVTATPTESELSS